MTPDINALVKTAGLSPAALFLGSVIRALDHRRFTNALIKRISPAAKKGEQPVPPP
jgi:hypothetical protein